MSLSFVRVYVGLFALTASGWSATLGLQPYLQDVRSDRATILWTTLDGAGTGEVRYSQDASFGLKLPSESRAFTPAETGMPYQFWLHRATLTGLKASTDYNYRVYVDGAWLTAASSLAIHTAAAPAITLLALGDSGDGAPVQQSLSRLMEAENAALVVHVGDLAYQDGAFLQLTNYFFDVYRRILGSVPFFAVPGNHDYGTGLAVPFRSMLSPPTDTVPSQDQGLYYSFDWGPIHFTGLDTNLPLQKAVAGSDPMLQWLEQDLQAARGQWRVVYFHHTPFPTNHHLNDPTCRTVQEKITPILERNSVHLVLSGHEHVYQRTMARRNGVFNDNTWGTIYVTTGGGGFALHPAGTAPFVKVGLSVSHYMRVEVSGSSMRVRAIGLSGETIDDFTISGASALDAVRDAASFSEHVAPGGLISIFGKDLARAYGQSAQFPLPASLASVSATINSKPLPLLFAGRTQVNAQLPYDLAPGPASLSLTGPNGSIQSNLAIDAQAPAVFQVGDVPAVTHVDGSLVTQSSPASAGEWLSAYMTGLGQVTPGISAGESVPLAPLRVATGQVEISLGGAKCAMGFAGLTSGMAGVNQVNFRVPTGSTGQLPLVISVGSVASSPVLLWTR